MKMIITIKKRQTPKQESSTRYEEAEITQIRNQVKKENGRISLPGRKARSDIWQAV